MFRKILIIIVIASAAVLTLALSIFTVQEGEIAIVTQFGKAVNIITEGGLYFKRPGFFQTINRLDKRIGTISTRPTQFLLGDKNPIIASCYIAWKIENPLLFFQSVGNPENAATKLEDMVGSHLGITFGEYSEQDIVSTDTNTPGTEHTIKLGDIEKKLTEMTTVSAREKYGIRIVKTGIVRLAYPDVVVRAIYDRMQSERAKEAERIQAEGREAAARIVAETDREASNIRSEAQKKSLVIKAEGDQQAMKISAKAFNKDPEFFNFLKSLETYETVMATGTTLILSTDSELFKYLNYREKGGKQ